MLNLEEIAQQTFNQKTSFFQKIRNSLVSKLAILISAGTFAFASCGPDDDQPFDSKNNLPPITTKLVDGIQVSSGKTNPNGEIKFVERSKDVDIYVFNGDKQQVDNAQVTYFDGNDFECFQVNHNNYTPQLECFAHNSSHTLSLTTSPLQVLRHDGYENERSKSAAINYTNWAEANWEYLGCRDKTQLEAMMDGGSYIIKLLSKVFTLGFSDSNVDAAYDYLKGELDENDAGHIYFFNPSKYGFYGTSTIWTIDFKTIEIENCSDNLDNDCDGRIDSEDNDCTCTNECSYSGQKECFGNGWKECGDFDSDICLEWSSLHSCASDEYCEDGQCIPACSDDCSPFGYKTCVGDSWKECGDFDSDNCLEWGLLNDCGVNQTCDNGGCVDITCLNDNDCDLGYICKKSTNECLEEPSPLCTGSNCLDVIIHIFDSGAQTDDSFGLEIVGSFYGETNPGGGKTWNIPMIENQTYEMVVYGIGIPDGIGTYTIELTNATVIDGPPLTGNDLDAGMTFTWHIKAEVCPQGTYECVNTNTIRRCENDGWQTYSCDDACIEIGGYPDGADYCGYNNISGHDVCYCLKTPCNQEFYQCEGINMTYCDLEEGVIKSFSCDTLCQDGGYGGATSCSYSSSYEHDACFCY